MAESPPVNNGDVTIASDLQIWKADPNFLETNVTIASPSPLAQYAPFTPLTQNKRKRLKPARYDVSLSNAKKKLSVSKPKVMHEPSKRNLSSGKKKTATRGEIPFKFSLTMIRAGEIQSSLGTEYPSFKKLMLKSHVTTCFWMGLPVPFCKSFLPQHDSLMVAEDENERQYNLKYIAYKTGLSAGWRGFSLANKLREGDVLVFQLVESSKLKVYIVRNIDPQEVDDALNLVNHDAQKVDGTLNLVNHNAQEVDGTVNLVNHDAHEVDGSPNIVNHDVQEVNGTLNPVNHDAQEVNGTLNPVNHDAQAKITTPIPATLATYSKLKGKKRSTLSSLPLSKVQKKPRSEPHTKVSRPPIDHMGVNSVVQGLCPSSNLSIENGETFQDFRIMVNERCIDSELSDEIRMNYYELCKGNNAILHDRVREGLYYKLVAGMIGETVNIAKMIKNCNYNTNKEECEVWDSSLKSFELIGMKVGFLRDRISELTKLAECEYAKRYIEAKVELKLNACAIKNLETKLAELKESNKKMDVVVSSLKQKAEQNAIEFQKKVNAPW